MESKSILAGYMACLLLSLILSQARHNYPWARTWGWAVFCISTGAFFGWQVRVALLAMDSGVIHVLTRYGASPKVTLSEHPMLFWASCLSILFGSAAVVIASSIAFLEKVLHVRFRCRRSGRA